MENNNDFFPTADYKIPETSNYLKLSEGEHNFRILSSAVIGWQYFSNENKPVRSRTSFDEMPSDIKKDGRINHFWAFVIYNYEAKRIQVLEITQKSIMLPMQALINNPKWGNPKNRYDITITRKGTTMNDTEYAVMPNPHTPTDESITEQFNKTKINLDALFENLDPFKTDNE